MGDDDVNNADQGNDNSNGDDLYNNASSTAVCKVYDKADLFTIAVQLLLLLFALASLWWKRLREVPRRTFLTWSLDMSKQALGAGYAHVLNMIIASIISTNSAHGETVLDDECAWYALSYIIDTTMGLLLAIIFLKLLDEQANRRNWVHLKHSGVYVGATMWVDWMSQVGAWILILTVVKLIIYVFMRIFDDPLAYVGLILFAPLQGNIRFELVFVMILFPGCLNVIYFWIADSFLKAKKEHAMAHEGQEDKKEALINEQDCDHDGGNAPYSSAPPLHQSAESSLQTELSGHRSSFVDPVSAVV